MLFILISPNYFPLLSAFVSPRAVFDFNIFEFDKIIIRRVLLIDSIRICPFLYNVSNQCYLVPNVVK